MPRSLAPCGTPAAYRRHRRNGEAACDKCRRAHAEKKTERRTAAKVVVLSALPPVEPEAEGVDELTVAREALVAVRTAMRSAPPGSVAILAQKSVELAATVRRLEAALKPRESKLDELARRRAERIASSQN